jgi:hypothetical protein
MRELMANRNWSSGGKVYQMHVSPVLIDCNFVVDQTNGNGLGIRNLKGPTVTNVFMNTTATPGIGNNGVTNPNPEAGIIVVQLADTYNRSLGGYSALITPVGTSTTATTSGVPAVITSLGTATLAQWQAVGLPIGLTPTVGQAFIPTSSATIGGGATVAPPAAAGSGITNIETIGDPNTTMNNIKGKFGTQIILQCMKNGVLTQPAQNAVISLSFMLNNSSVLVSGE